MGGHTPEEAKKKIEEQREDALLELKTNHPEFIIDGQYQPQNLEEQAICLAGKDIYEKLIKGYTEKLDGIECKTNTNFFDSSYSDWRKVANQLVYTGAIDEFYQCRFGRLDWRTVSFETVILNTCNYQGNAVVNYTDYATPFTRVIEHKHFESFGVEIEQTPKTVISKEYSVEYKPGMEQFYPINDDRNNTIAEKYRELARQETDIIFGGRLAEYRYYDMAPVIEKVINEFYK